MGEEFGAQTPFLFFCDFEKDLAAAVTAGRRNEFARFTRFSNPDARRGIPDPNAVGTFEASKLDWTSVDQRESQDWLRLYRRLLSLRSEHIVPHLASACKIVSSYEVFNQQGLKCRWEFADGCILTVLANLSDKHLFSISAEAAEIIHASEGVTQALLQQETLLAWSVVWFLKS
jgi:1,4-alpha-glucan branching enzyme